MSDSNDCRGGPRCRGDAQNIIEAPLADGAVAFQLRCHADHDAWDVPEWAVLTITPRAPAVSCSSARPSGPSASTRSPTSTTARTSMPGRGRQRRGDARRAGPHGDRPGLLLRGRRPLECRGAAHRLDLLHGGDPRLPPPGDRRARPWQPIAESATTDRQVGIPPTSTPDLACVLFFGDTAGNPLPKHRPATPGHEVIYEKNPHRGRQP